MILICRFRRPLATAQTNRFALRLARDSARKANCAARGRLRVLDFGRTTFGLCVEGQRAAAALAPKALFSPAWGIAPGFVAPQNNISAEGAIHFRVGLRDDLLN